MGFVDICSTIPPSMLHSSRVGTLNGNSHITESDVMLPKSLDWNHTWFIFFNLSTLVCCFHLMTLFNVLTVISAKLRIVHTPGRLRFMGIFKFTQHVSFDWKAIRISVDTNLLK